jgi:ATP-dependent Clp protease ATP-binding subunit ClpB
MTSNLGSDIITASLKNGNNLDEQTQKNIHEILRRSVKPEFLNRIDEVIVFKPLGFEEIKGIVERQLKKVEKNVQEYGYEINFSDKVKDYLAHEGFDPVYGARPLRRAIQRLIENPLSRHIIAGNFKKGSKINIDLEKGEVTFK